MSTDWAPLADGYKIPLLGLGTYKITDQNDMNNAVSEALSCGYRLFDTAKYYLNEKQLGNALELLLPKFGLSRKDVFIITKIWPFKENNVSQAIDAVQDSLLNLKCEYIDLVLIHYPKSNDRLDEDGEQNKLARCEVWQALCQEQEKGNIRSIGVSNFEPHHIEELKQVSSKVPVVNQCEFHPLFTRTSIRQYCKQHQILFQGYSVIARCNDALISHPTVIELAEKHKVSPCTLLIAFVLSQKYGAIVKSATPARIAENASAQALTLSDDETQQLLALDDNKPFIRGTPWLVK